MFGSILALRLVLGFPHPQQDNYYHWLLPEFVPGTWSWPQDCVYTAARVLCFTFKVAPPLIDVLRYPQDQCFHLLDSCLYLFP